MAEKRNRKLWLRQRNSDLRRSSGGGPVSNHMEKSMRARNGQAAGVFIREVEAAAKGAATGWKFIFAFSLCMFAWVSPLRAQSSSSLQDQAAEIKQLRQEVSELREDLKRLHELLGDTKLGETKQPAGEAPQPVQPEVKPSAPSQQEAGEEKGLPLYTGRIESPNVAMATKAHGGDLSGAGNLLRTDRITVGGYGDFQFRTPALSERADGGGTSTFQSTRFVLGVAAVLSQKQNITFNSEIEYELGTSEIDVEQAFVSWRVRPEFDFRAGIIVPPLG